MQLDQRGGNNPPVKISPSPSRPLTPSLETTLVENFCRAGLVLFQGVSAPTEFTLGL